MGGSPYWYIVPHEDPKAALEKLRMREFKAGRYYPAVERPRFPVTEKSPAPGAKHKTIAEAIEASDASGTQSILDIDRISEKPEFLAATAVGEDDLKRLFKTTKPTREVVLDDMVNRMRLFSEIERGHAVFLPLYEKGKALSLLFVGYSVD